jgi:hypothetical protein
MKLSNTLALENHGWDGLYIEPNPVYWYGLSHRRCTVVRALVGEKVEAVNVKFRGVFGGIGGKMDEKLANWKREAKVPQEKRYTAPLQEVLKRFNAPKQIGYLSLDVEGAEYLIMQNFPGKNTPSPYSRLKGPRLFSRIFLANMAEYLWAHASTGLTPDHPMMARIITDEVLRIQNYH